MHRHTRLAALGLAALSLTVVSQAFAQSWGERLKRITERAVKSEIERKVDQETRKVTRCALGDDYCVREAERRGERVETVAANGGAAASADPGGDHPLIVPYQGSYRKDRDYSSYTDYVRIIGHANKRPVTERLEGKLTSLRYENPGGRSPFEILRNYRDALTAKGLKVDWECASQRECGSTGFYDGRSYAWKGVNGMDPGIASDTRYFTGRMPYGPSTAYVSIVVNPHITDLHVLETTGMQTGMVSVTADALAAQLEQTGKATLEGIYFDTGRATLKQESNAALDQAAQLMRQQSSLQLLVVGHTDNTGNAGANMSLSQQRAEAVRNALLARGVPATRLSAQGVGSSVPVASNATESGRAQNRRVELVRQ